jgi:hypothetical protein
MHPAAYRQKAGKVGQQDAGRLPAKVRNRRPDNPEYADIKTYHASFLIF